MRKLLLTGLLAFVYQGSMTQLGFALFVILVSKEVAGKLGPYVDDHDDTLARARAEAQRRRHLLDARRGVTPE